MREAIGAAGRSEFGLQAGLFTNDMRVVEDAADGIDVGGLMVKAGHNALIAGAYLAKAFGTPIGGRLAVA